MLGSSVVTPEVWIPGLGKDLLIWLPEGMICFAIVFILLARISGWHHYLKPAWISYLAILLALTFCICQWESLSSTGSMTPFSGTDQQPGPEKATADSFEIPVYCFSNNLVFDRLSLFFRILVLAATGISLWITLLTRTPSGEGEVDFHVLFLGAGLGLLLMVSANHFLLTYLAIEMASLASYSLVGFQKWKRKSGEAALKYILYGSAASGIMLYGISFFAGRLGTGTFPDIANAFLHESQLARNQQQVLDPVLIMGAVFILTGIAFKMAAVPFHFWCPDAMEGATNEVASLLAVASKGAALGILVRLSLLFSGMDIAVNQYHLAGMNTARYLVPTLGLLGIITATAGNLGAYMQTNLRRLLAYSGISHTGYLLLGLAPLTRSSIRATLFYLVAYLIMNLGAFGMIAFFQRTAGAETLAGYRGLIRRSPLMVVCFSLFILSLLGIPPLVGFTAKFLLLLGIVDGATVYFQLGEDRLGWFLYFVVGAFGFNTLLGAFYYLKILRVMIFDRNLEDIEGREARLITLSPDMRVFGVTMAIAVVVLGLYFSPLVELTGKTTSRFVARPTYQNEILPITPGK